MSENEAQVRDAKPSLTETIGKWVAVVSAVIGAAITAATYIDGRAKEEAARYEAFRNAATAEEQFWKSLWDSYLKVYDGKEDASGLIDKRGEAKILAILGQAQRESPSFADFNVDENIKCESRRRLAAAKKALIDSLIDSVQDADLRQKIVQRAYVGKVVPKEGRVDECLSPLPASPSSQQADDVSPWTGALRTLNGSPSPSPSAVGIPDNNPQKELIVRASGIGWDIDIFWCAESKTARDQAFAIGKTLAPLVIANQRIAPGTALGSVKLVRSSKNDKKYRDFFETGSIVFGTEAGERDTANAVAEIIKRTPELKQLTPRLDQGSTSRWYLSAFVCDTQKTT